MNPLPLRRQYHRGLVHVRDGDTVRRFEHAEQPMDLAGGKHAAEPDITQFRIILP